MNDRQIVTITTASLAQALATVLPFASDDVTLPSLCAVQLNAGGGVLTATATNRYLIGHSRQDATGDWTRPMLLESTFAHRLLDVLHTTIEQRGTGADLVAITADLDADGHTPIAFTFAGTTISTEEPYWPFPDLAPLVATLATDDDAELLGPVALGTTALRILVEALTALQPDGDPQTRWCYRGSHKPIRVESGDRFLAVVMPHRMEPQPHVPFGLPADRDLAAATA